uniref:Uncharacterized protein n=1 Tax=Rhizophora mucronata TaxID=61149 RepID=A0A2P2QVK5_RHIMU
MNVNHYSKTGVIRIEKLIAAKVREVKVEITC